MVPYLGKREAGALTAASPGDTLYFPFASYNDSGDSEVLSGLAVTDIEVFKDGSATARATDSGYSLISDTGMVGDRAGLYRVRIQLFNTADDASFYAAGSHYMAAIDSVTVDGKTVRFWLGTWEIGRQVVNVDEIDGDTGALDRLQKFASSKIDPNGHLDTGTFTGAPLLVDIRRVLGDTGAAHLDQGRFGVISDSGRMAAVMDTGKAASAVWTSHGTRALTAFAHDTGVRDTVWKTQKSSYDTDTGSVAYAIGNVTEIRGDTGAANWLRSSFAAGFADTGLYSRLDKLAEDTGGVNVNSIQGDTGAAGWLKAAYLNGFNDTGLNDRLARILADTDTGIQGGVNVTSFADTGINDRLARILADTDTGIQGGVHVTSFSDTGVNNRLSVIASDTDTGIQSSVNVTAFADTGVNNRLAVIAADTDTGIQSSVTVTGLSDTGVNERLNAIETQTNKLTFDTGNQLAVDVEKVNGVTVGGAGSAGNPWGPA